MDAPTQIGVRYNKKRKGVICLSTKLRVRVAYGGPDVESGTMDIKQLAPALLAFGAMIEEGNKAINGEDLKIRVRVQSDFQKGSFDVGMELVGSLAEQIRLFSGSLADVSKLGEHFGFVADVCGVAGMGLIPLIKKIAGRKIKSAVVIENGNTRLELFGDAGFESIEVHPNVVKLYRSAAVRKHLEDTLAPLESSGIDVFKVRAANGSNGTAMEVVKSEKEYFRAPAAVAETPPKRWESERNAVFKIVGVSFEEQLKWRLDDGETKIYASIQDQEFLGEVESRQHLFGKGDTLEVRLKTTQELTDKGIKTEYEILKVIEHHKKPDQIPLITSDD